MGDGIEECSIEGAQLGIGWFERAALQEDGDAGAPAFQLPFMEEHGAGQCGDRDRACLKLCRRKGCGGSRFVVILQKAEQARLVQRWLADVSLEGWCIPGFEIVIRCFVVAEVEALLHQLRFAIPIGFGDEEKVWVRRSYSLDDGCPEVSGNRL